MENRFNFVERFAPLSSLQVTVVELDNGKFIIAPEGMISYSIQPDHVLVWYQNGNAWNSYFADPGLTLVPELLVHDENLIRVDRVRVIVFMCAGFLSALAGILMVARMGTAQPSIGENWVLPSIAASVIGGVSTTGGVGGPIGAILGSAIVNIIENIIILVGVNTYWQSGVSGAVVVVAISVDALSRKFFRKDG